MTLKYGLLIIISVFVFKPVWSAPPLVVKVGVFENPPLVFTDKNGLYSGLAIDVLEDIAEKEGWKLKYIHATWRDVFTKLKKGEIDLLVGIAHSEKRAKLFDFTRETLVNNWGIIYRQSDAKISSMLDLKGKRLAVMKGSIHTKVLKKLLTQFNIECTLIEVESYNDVLKTIDEGHADAGAINRLFSMLHASMYNVAATTIVYNPVRVHYASPKSSQKSFVKVIDKHLSRQKKDSNSVYQRSVDRWLSSAREKPFPPWFIWGGIGILAFMITVLVFNILLRREVRKRTTELRKSERRLQGILDNSSAVIHMKDLQGSYILINRHCERIFKTTNSEVAGKTDYDFFPKETADTFRTNDLKALETKCSIEFEEEIYYDNSLHTYLTIKFPVNLPDGTIYGTCGISSEITERKLMEESLRKNEFNLARAQQIAHLGNWELDIVSQREVWSDETYRILGFNPKQFSPDHKQFLNSVHPDDRKLIRQGITEAIEDGKPLSIDFRIIQPDGTQRFVHSEGEIIFDQVLKPSLMVGIIQDITQIKESEERLNYLAHHDPLTHLPNRLLFKDRLQQAISLAHRNKQLVALLFLDLDRFKIINDTLGHVVGDKLLQLVAKRLLKGLREVDTVARLGGDEFTVILSDIEDTSDISLVAQKILDNLSEIYKVDNYEFFLNASIGIARYPLDGEDWETLFKHADIAMYEAKARGGDTYQFYAKSLTDVSIIQLKLETRLRKALEREEFVLYYQPQVDIDTGLLTGVEVLTYWQQEDELISPSIFIPLAEETGLIVPFGEWVLHNACTQNKAWQDEGLEAVPIAVNLSARQFQQSNLLKLIDQTLIDTGLSSNFLELELTESMLVHVDRATSLLHSLKEIGIKISIDDFGTGYSSLNYLKRFPIDTLKIDQSFIRDVVADQDDAAITKAIIAMGHSLRLDVIAEGVETKEQLAFLRKHQCNKVQGYFYSRPVPSESVTRFLKKNYSFHNGR